MGQPTAAPEGRTVSVIKAGVNQLIKLVGNPFAYASQQPDGTWVPNEWSGDWHELLQGHYGGKYTVGTYVLRGDQARTLVFDLDSGEADLEKAEAIQTEAIRLGVPKRSTGIEFSGNKGYHVWVVVADYVPAKELRHLGRTILNLLEYECEVFPKQDEAKKLGNLVKLPCGIHQVSGKENNFVDRVPAPMSKQVWTKIVKGLPPLPKPKPKFEDIPEGVLPCMAHIAKGAPQGHRNNALYHYASLLRGTNRLTDEAVDLLVRDAAAKCDPPYSGWELEQLIESSKTGGPLCDSLPEGIRCPAEMCVKNSRKGKALATRKGQLKMAQKGEGVVMEVTEKNGGTVQLDHPDLKAGGTVAV